MPLYTLHCLDKTEGGAEARAKARPDHLAWAVGLGDTVRMAGALLSPEGNMIGSMFIIQADSLAAAKALHAQDPYVAGGVFGDVQIHEAVWAIGAGKPE